MMNRTASVDQCCMKQQNTEKELLLAC